MANEVGKKSAVDEMDDRIAAYQERLQISWEAAVVLECVCDGKFPFTLEFPADYEVDQHDVFQALHELLGKCILRVRGRLTLDWAQPDYKQYIQSPEWKAKADAAKAKADHRCQVCNSPKKPLDAHHRTYERLGNELPEDIVVLCRKCHSMFHENGQLAR